MIIFFKKNPIIIGMAALTLYALVSPHAALAAFNPSSISGLRLWLDASQGVYQDSSLLTPATADGDRVGGWTDLSGNSMNATQATSTNRPTLKLNRVNGRPALQFSAATSTYLVHPYGGELGTVFVVGKRTSTVSNNDTWLGADTTDAVAVGAYYFKAGNTGGTLEFYRTLTTDTSSSGWSAQLTNGDVYNTWYVQGGTVSTTTKAMTLWKNDIIVGSGKTATGVRPIKAGTTVIGSSYYNHSLSGSYLNGEIAEILVYDHALSDAEVRQVDSYLSDKYGISYLTQLAAPSGSRPKYVYPSFGGSSERLRMFYSSDGITFQETFPVLNGYYLSVRDPDLFYASGHYWIAYTNTTFGSSTTSFGLARADNWYGPYTQVAVPDQSAISGVNRVWSPIHFIDPADGSLHILFSATTGGDSGNFKQYHIEPTSADLTTWSTPVEIGGVATTYSNTIAGFIQKKGSTYYLWIKDESATGGGGKYNVIMSSNSPFTGYTTYKIGNWASWGQDKYEGAYPVQIGSNTWRVYMDNYNNGTGGEYYSESTDDWATWSTPAALTVPSGYGQSRNGILLFSSASLSASPSMLDTGNPTATIQVTGSGTSWLHGTLETPTFTISGAPGTTIVSQSVIDGTHATIRLSTGTTAGTLTLFDPSTEASTAISITTPSAPFIPASSSGSGKASSQEIAQLMAFFAGKTIPLTLSSSLGCPAGYICTPTTQKNASLTLIRDLSVGSTGSDVLALQQFLNAHGFAIASAGAGSPGHETAFFGSATRNAVIRFQKASNISPTAGYVGPKTRAAIAQQQ